MRTRIVSILFCLVTFSLSSYGQVTSLMLNSDQGDYIGEGQLTFLTPTDGSFTAQQNFDQGVSISFYGQSDFWFLDFSAPNNQLLAVGAYTGATRFPFQSQSEPGLSVAGDGRGCNTLTGSFQVLEISYGSGMTINSFDAVFEQHCEGAVPALHGEIRFNAHPGGKSLPLADLFLRIKPTPATIHQGDLLTYAFPVWNLGPDNASQEVLITRVPEGTTFDYIRISGTPGLGTCTTPPYGGRGQIICHENSVMAPNTTWTVRLTVKVTAPSGNAITEDAVTMADTLDSNLGNNTASVNTTVE